MVSSADDDTGWERVTMDCRDAQNLFDAAQADARDLWEPDIAPAAVHLETCRDCQRTLQKKNRFDREFGIAVRDVEIPAGLNDRLRAALAAASGEPAEKPAAVSTTGETSLAETDANDVPESRGQRRRMWWMSTAALVVVAAVGLFSFWPSGGASVPLHQLLAEFVVQGQYQTPFDENFAATLPAEGWDSKRLHLDGPFGYSSADTPRDQAAVYRFLLRSRRDTIRGKLVVIPAARVADLPPNSTIFEVTAESSSDGSYSHAAWTEGEFVYVCYVDGHAGNFSTLQQALAPRLG